MAGPFDSLPFGIGDEPAAQPFSLPNPFLQKRRDPQFPLLPMQEQESLLAKIGQGATSGLGYLGEVLNKPGRAIRGLLGGNPRDALAILPFSDTLHITNPDNQVSGKDLLAKLGILKPNDDTWLGTLAGVGTEIATDPLTYINPFTPLTKAGSVMKAAGILPKGLRASMEGLGAIGAREASALAEVGKTAADVAGPGRSLLSFHVPFTDFTVPIGTGAMAQKVASYGDRAMTAVTEAEKLGDISSYVAKIPGLRSLPNPVPYARGLFDWAAGGSTIPVLQKVFGNEVAPGLRAGKANAVEGMLGNLRTLEGATHYNPAGAINETGLTKVMRQFAEGRGGNVNMAELGPGSELAAQMGTERRALQYKKLTEAQELGIPLTEFIEKTPAGEILLHDPRYASAIEGAGAGGNWRNQKLMPTSHPSMIARDEAIRNLPADTVNSLYKDARLSGPNRVYQDPKTAAQVIAQEYLGNPQAPDPKLLFKQSQAEAAFKVADGQYNQVLEGVRARMPNLFDPVTGQPTIQIRQYSPADWAAIDHAKAAMDAAKTSLADVSSEVSSIVTKQGDVATQAQQLAKKLAAGRPHPRGKAGWHL
jgi:hypothetical protein